MSTVAENLPCIIGVAQQTWRPKQGDAPEPMQQWVQMAGLAAEDAGNADLIAQLDELDVIYSLTWGYDDAPAELAEQLGIGHCRKKLSGLSGTSPQKFINEAAEQILRGDTELAMVVGGEALATKKRSKKEDRLLLWYKAKTRRQMPFDSHPHPSEISHQIYQAYLTFAILDSARRHHLGLSLDDNRRQQAQMMAAMSEVAADNPLAWFPTAHSPNTLLQTDGNNRMVAYPYSKLQMAFMDVDMAAAVIIASDKKADELGVPRDKRVYLHGWGYAQESTHIAERPELWHSPAMEVASRQAMQMADLSIEDIELFDIYSCFPSSLNFGCDALGLSEAQRDGRLTMTGGLPYFGGPGNNYSTHAVAEMVQALRRGDGATGLVSGVGMHMTHHVFGVYGATPPAVAPVPPDYAEAQRQVDAVGSLPIDEDAAGPATIAAYSVEYGRERTVAYAICDLDNGHRCYAICDDADTLEQLVQQEWVGRRVELSSEDKINRFYGRGE